MTTVDVPISISGVQAELGQCHHLLERSPRWPASRSRPRSRPASRTPGQSPGAGRRSAPQYQQESPAQSGMYHPGGNVVRGHESLNPGAETAGLQSFRLNGTPSLSPPRSAPAMITAWQRLRISLILVLFEGGMLLIGLGLGTALVCGIGQVMPTTWRAPPGSPSEPRRRTGHGKDDRGESQPHYHQPRASAHRNWGPHPPGRAGHRDSRSVGLTHLPVTTIIVAVALQGLHSGRTTRPGHRRQDR